MDSLNNILIIRENFDKVIQNLLKFIKIYIKVQ